MNDPKENPSPWASPISETYCEATIEEDSSIELTIGLPRLSYIVMHICLGIGVFFTLPVAGILPRPYNVWLVLLAFLFLLVGLVVLRARRLENMGYRNFFILLFFIPVVNILMEVACLCCQANFKRTNRLDNFGFFVLFQIALVLLPVFLFGVLIPVLMYVTNIIYPT